MCGEDSSVMEQAGSVESKSRVVRLIVSSLKLNNKNKEKMEKLANVLKLHKFSYKEFSTGFKGSMHFF